jgi:plastocyanin
LLIGLGIVHERNDFYKFVLPYLIDVIHRNMILQGIGVAIIVIAIAAIAYSAQMARKSANSANQPSGTLPVNVTKVSTSVQKANNPSSIVVTVPVGAGRQGTLSEFFVPSKVNLHTGNKVTWVDDDTVTHSITSATFNGVVWPRGSDQGPSNFSHTFDKSGTFNYFCQIHPYMTGVAFVDVQETERVLNSTTAGSSNFVNVKIEMPRNAAYINNYGPYFLPTYAVVPLNSRVTWTNEDYVAHTATATDGSFDTSPVLPGESYTLTIQHNPGTIGYFCKIHPWMQAMMYLAPSQSQLNLLKHP